MDLPYELSKRISRRQFLFHGKQGEPGVLPLVVGVGALGLGVMGLGSPKSKTLTELGGTPSPHDNSDHSLRYIQLIVNFGTNYTAAGVTVDNTADATLATFSTIISAGFEAFFAPFGADFNVAETANLTGANLVMDVWWVLNDDGVDTVGAKFPITVVLGETFKRKQSFGPVVNISMFSKLLSVLSGTITITLKARIQGAASPSPTVSVTDRSARWMAFQRDTP